MNATDDMICSVISSPQQRTKRDQSGRLESWLQALQSCTRAEASRVQLTHSPTWAARELALAARAGLHARSCTRVPAGPNVGTQEERGFPNSRFWPSCGRTFFGLPRLCCVASPKSPQYTSRFSVTLALCRGDASLRARMRERTTIDMRFTAIFTTPPPIC